MDAALICLALFWQSQRIRQLEFKLYIDSLTQIGNRAAFDDALSNAWDNWIIGGQDFALLYLDGNGIKDINDSFGHDVGDRFIQEIASCIRCYDQAFRLGGDEFAVILTADRDRIPAIIERIHHQVFLAEQQLRSQLGPQAHLSAAIGWSMASSASNPIQLKQQADQDMYAQKAAFKRLPLPQLVLACG
jgi:diguanylate cyclase (GGDEF)-like protein